MANRVELPIVVLDGKSPTSPVNGASCVIKDRVTKTEANVYKDSGATEEKITQPLSTDEAGRLTGWMNRGAYEVEITIPGKVPYGEPFDAAPGKNESIETSWLKNEVVTGEKIATAIKDGAVGTASLRTLGTGATQATAGNDARLSDERTPKANSVTAAKIEANAVGPSAIGSLPGCKLYNTGEVEVTNLATKYIEWNSEEEDIEGMHSTSSNKSRITCVTPGLYIFYVDFRATSIVEGDTLGAWFRRTKGSAKRKFGVNKHVVGAGGGAGISGVVATAHIRLSAGDYVETAAFCASSGGCLLEGETTEASETNFGQEVSCIWVSD